MKRQIFTFPLAVILAVFIFSTNAISAEVSEVQKPEAVEEQKTLTEEDIMPYLEQVISWHREVLNIEIAPGNAREILLKENLRRTSARLINSAFDFAKAQAAIIEKNSPQTEKPVVEVQNKNNLVKISERIVQRLKDLQHESITLNAELAKVTADKREILNARKAKVTSEIKLAQAQYTLLQSTISLSSQDSSNTSATLVGKIDNLYATVPQLDLDTPSDGKTTVNQTNISNISNKGILGLTRDMMNKLSVKTELAGIGNFTTTIRDENQKLIEILRNELRAKVKSGNELSQETGQESAENIYNQKEGLDALVLDFKRLSNVLTPLNQTNIWADAADSTLKEWQSIIDTELKETMNSLLLRLGILGIAIIIPLFLNHVAKKATNRYVHDPRRLRVLKIARRIIFSVVIGIIVLLNLMTEYGSLVTFAGLLTAGIAVALQTIIVSFVAYFFFFTRFGLRVGDRVTVGGITGEVIKIGMVRFYMMELAGTDFDLNPTGRVVGYPNSVLFQPAAFIKLAPGTNYTWNEIRIQLDAESDYEQANLKLMEAVDRVYDEYREIMEAQQAALQRATSLSVQIAPPKSHLRFTDSGLTFIVRYPIEISRAAEVKEKMTRELMEAIRATPKLKLA